MSEVRIKKFIESRRSNLKFFDLIYSAFSENKIIVPAKYQGNYFIVCRKCPNGINQSSKIGKHIQYERNGDFVIQRSANQINNFKRNHDAEGHNWTILHETVVPKYVSQQMIGDKKCLIIAV